MLGKERAGKKRGVYLVLRAFLRKISTRLSHNPNSNQTLRARRNPSTQTYNHKLAAITTAIFFSSSLWLAYYLLGEYLRQ